MKPILVQNQNTNQKITKSPTHGGTKLMFGKGTATKSTLSKPVKGLTRNSGIGSLNQHLSPNSQQPQNNKHSMLGTQGASHTIKDTKTLNHEHISNVKTSKVTATVHKTGGKFHSPESNIPKTTQLISPQSALSHIANHNQHSHQQSDHISHNMPDRQSTDNHRELPQKRHSIHSKRGRNQPSQQVHGLIQSQQSPTSANQNNQGQQNIIMSNQQVQDVVMLNLPGTNGQHHIIYGNDEDIYEVGNLMHDVFIVNQVKLKEESSYSINASQILKNMDNMRLSNQFQTNLIHQNDLMISPIASSNKKSLLAKQRGFNDLQAPIRLLQTTDNKILGPVEQEIDEGLSRIDESEFKRMGLIERRSLSFSSCDELIRYQGQNTQSNIFRDYSKRPESSLLKSLSSCHIIRKDSSRYDSPSERTILDVLGICGASGGQATATDRNEFKMKRNSGYKGFDRIVPVNMKNDFINFGDDDAGHMLLLQNSNYQYENRYSNIHDYTSSNQIIFNQYTGSENSFSTNRVVNNFLEEKKKELEALQEVDRESDTTEQMTYSQNSRAQSLTSRNDDRRQQSSKKRSKSKLQDYLNDGLKKGRKSKTHRLDGGEWDDLQRRSNMQMVSIRDLLETQTNPHNEDGLGISSGQILRTQPSGQPPKMKSSRSKHFPFLLQNSNLMQHSTSAYCLFPSSEKDKKSKALQNRRHQHDQYEQNDDDGQYNLMSFSNNQLKSLHNSISQSIIITPKSCREDIGGPDERQRNVEYLERMRTPDDQLNTTEIAIGGNNINNNQAYLKASQIKSFNFKPSKGK